ncbi:MAG: quinone-dependent dihydroorotate dehydrogenase [Methylovirgula sp.]
MSASLFLCEIFAQRLLLWLRPEFAHRLTIRALALLRRAAPSPDDPRLAVSAFGLDFPNPLGLAAGFDKNGEVVDAMLRLGFGFVEVGTVTPRPQRGNTRPRVFRLRDDRAVVNRLGFNSLGHKAVHRRLAARYASPGIVAANLGANRHSEDRIADYVAGIEAFADVAQFFVINISSPNTPGLRDLQRQQELDDLLPRVLAARDAALLRRPVVVKIAPDLTLEELDGIVRVCRAHRIDALAVSNTTLARPPDLIDSDEAKQQGGLSGRPLFTPSTRLLAQTYLRVENQFPLIGIGGVEDAATAFAKIEAGASLIELYSALIFKGPGLVEEIKRGLLAKVEAAGLSRLAEARGRGAADWAEARVTDTDLG